MDLSRISKKNPYEDLRITLSAIDNKTVEKFNNELNNIEEKKKILSGLIKKKNGSRIKYNNEYHDLCKKIKELEKEIEETTKEKQKIDYLMKAAAHFLNYTTKNEEPSSQEIVNGFFITKDINKRGQICQNYVKECIGNGYSLSTKSSEICQELTCHNCGIEKLTNPRESYASCPNCGMVSRYQDLQNNKGEYSEEVEVLSPFAYKKINHFKEWISTLLGREGSGIPQEIIDEILREFKKDKIESVKEVTEKRIRMYLKKLKRAKLYEHIPAIKFKLCGIPPPQISPQLENKLVEMFQQIQGPFERHSPKKRKNFLSYSYCIHKELQLLRQSELLSNLPLLKSREKLYYQDLIWKGICSDLGWKFFPSL